MKWLCLFFFLSAVQPLFAIFEQLTELEEKGHQKVSSIEGKLKRLEEELGIKTTPPTTTFNIFGDFLYWKASLDGVAYATTAVEVLNADGTEGFDRFKTRMAHFEYDPGFSIGAGIGLPYDRWDIEARWLRFYTTGRDQAHGSLADAIGNRVILDSIGMLENLLSPPSKATADCQIHLNLVDLLLGRTFLWSNYFEFKPFAGLRGAWVDIDWDIAFTRPIITPSLIDQSYAFLDVDNDFNAIGFLGGFESKWSFYKGLGLFSYATAALIYGKSSEQTKEKLFLVPALGTTTFEQTLKARNSTHAVKSVFDLALGLKWEIQFKQHYGFLIRAGYEFFYWPNVIQKTIIQSNRIRDRSDLSFQGIIIGARFDF
jgi:hypothetical protein